VKKNMMRKKEVKHCENTIFYPQALLLALFFLKKKLILIFKIDRETFKLVPPENRKFTTCRKLRNYCSRYFIDSTVTITYLTGKVDNGINRCNCSKSSFQVSQSHSKQQNKIKLIHTNPAFMQLVFLLWK
jgi:hypothetical protein